ncbi:kinectin isoform 2-T2 [Rhinophrynus dorsalis]
MEFYESTYFIILVPSVVITVIFLFFWLFMKETSYDEILAKQKKDLKPPPAKIDKRKTDKKKNKKKESQNGNLHESDSETAIRDFDLGDALSSEEEHVVPAPIVPVETLGNVRERKKKDKKQSKTASEEQLSKEINGTKLPGKKADTVPVTKQPTPPPDAPAAKKKPGQKKPKNGRDDSPLSPDTKTEQVVPLSKKQEPHSPPIEMKAQETGAGKKKASVKKQKIENVSALVDEPLIQPTVYIPLMDNSEVVVPEKKDVVNLEKPEVIEGLQKAGGKKIKTVTDKENAEVKFKDFLVTMRNMIFTEDEAMSVVEMLKDKSSAVQEIIHKANKGDNSAALHQLQEKEKLLAAARDEAAIVKEQFKQLTQELVAEKQKSNLVEAKARERISALEKEHGVFQTKIHSGYQELQQMQIKFQQLREQLESQITHLKQENGILRDAVSSATNQMESKQSSDLNKLRQDYARLMNELTEKNNRVAQEELQKKNSEQAAVQLKAQLQEAERRLEEVETYLRKRMTECELSQQDMQAKLIAKENEVQSLHSKLTDTMVSKQQVEQKVMQLMDAGQGDSLQLKVQDLMKQNEALNAQVQKCHSQMAAQSTASVLVEELQNTIAEKDKAIKQMEDSLALEHANFTNRGEELKELLKQNEALNAHVQQHQAQIASQSSAMVLVEELQKTIVEKEKEIKQVKDSLALEHANVANSGEELKALQRENSALKADLQTLQTLKTEQAAAAHALEQMQKSIREKDGQIRTLEERLQGELSKVSTSLEDSKASKDAMGQMEKSIQEKDEKIKTVEELLETGLIEVANKEGELRILRDENVSLRMELKTLQDQQRAQVSSEAQVQDLQNELKGKEESLKLIEVKYMDSEKVVADKERQIEDLQKECKQLKVHIQEVQQQLQQDSASSQVQDLQKLLEQQEGKVKNLETTLSEKEKHISDKSQELQVLRAENDALKVQAETLTQKHEQIQQQASSTAHSEELLKALAQKDRCITDLQGELESLKSAVEQQRKKNNDLREKNWKAMEALASTEKMLQERVTKTAKEKQQHAEVAENESRQVLQKLFPKVSVSANLSHREWLQEFEKLARNCLNESVGTEQVKVMEQKLKEGEEIHTLLQLECEKYKSVLAETEGILQRLQRSVEEEEGRWKCKVEESQQELNKVRCTVSTLEQEVKKLRRREKEAENLQKEREHLEAELEKAETERTIYVSEVRELKDLLTELQRKLDDSYSEAIRQNEELSLLKTQLNETLQKLEGDQRERQKVASDLHEAQKSLDLIQLEILKTAGDTNVIENSGISPETDGEEKKEKMSQSLSQTLMRLQQCLQAVNQQLTKGREPFQIIG